MGEVRVRLAGSRIDSRVHYRAVATSDPAEEVADPECDGPQTEDVPSGTVVPLFQSTVIKVRGVSPIPPAHGSCKRYPKRYPKRTATPPTPLPPLPRG